MNINIWGCGYIGTLSSVYLASLGHNVIGIDVDADKIDSLTKGEAPFSEKDVNELLVKYISSGKLKFRQRGFEHADMDVICVATPNSSSGELSMRFINTVAREIHINNTNAHIVIRSTIPVGYDQILRDKYSDDNLRVSLFPEFLREGNAVEDTFFHNQLIIGCARENQSQFELLLNKDERDVLYVSNGVAGSIKMVNNSWHATKIAFVNEVARLFSNYNVDYNELLKVFRHDHMLNLGDAYLRPGFAYGGSCLPKDSRGMSALAMNKDVKIPMVDQVNSSNKEHLMHIRDNILRRHHPNIGIILSGMSFKKGTNDLRNSPSIELLEMLQDKVSVPIVLRDDSLRQNALFGENLRIFNNHLRHYTWFDSDTTYNNHLVVNIHEYRFDSNKLPNCVIVNIDDLL